MLEIDLKITGDAAWPELDPARNPELELVELQSEHLEVVFLDNGTAGGKPVVIIRSDNNGKAYVVQLTGRQFQAVAAALKGKYGVIE